MRKFICATVWLLLVTAPLFGGDLYRSDPSAARYEKVDSIGAGYVLEVTYDEGSSSMIETLYLNGSVRGYWVTMEILGEYHVSYYEDGVLLNSKELSLDQKLLSTTEYLSDGRVLRVMYEGLSESITKLTYFLDGEFQYEDTYLRDTDRTIQRRVRSYPDGTSEERIILPSQTGDGGVFSVEGNDDIFRLYYSGDQGVLDYQRWVEGQFVEGRISEKTEDNQQVIQITDTKGNRSREVLNDSGRLLRKEVYDKNDLLAEVQVFSYTDELLKSKEVYTKNNSYLYEYTYNAENLLTSETMYQKGTLTKHIQYLDESVKIVTIYLERTKLISTYQSEVLMLQVIEPYE